jgi:hypothetical protein
MLLMIMEMVATKMVAEGILVAPLQPLMYTFLDAEGGANADTEDDGLSSILRIFS